MTGFAARIDKFLKFIILMFPMYFFIVFVILWYASITLTGQQHLAWGDAVDIVHWLDTKIRCVTLWLYGINWLNK